MRVERIELSEWAELLPPSEGEVFHDPAALEVLAAHAGGDLALYAGYNGQQAVALFPAIVQHGPVGKAVLSPPPSLGVPRLGPILMPASPKQRKREKLNAEFTELVLDAVDADSWTTLFRVVCNRSYLDPRPYVWADLALETEFTYVLDVTSVPPEELRGSFSKSLRREIRDAEELGVTVAVEGHDGTRAVYDDIRARYEEQGRQFPMEWAYVSDLVEALDEKARTYVARTPDGEFLGGITVLYSNDSAYFWQGGGRVTYENVAVNSLIHWRIILDLYDDPPASSIGRYDLMGANTERLCRYKSKFGAELVPYYVVESAGRPMEVAKRTYRMVAR